ncbi:MAG: hypothetical protein R3F02_01335 [Thiolinea sp.]
MHTYIESSAQQPPVTGEGTLKSPAHLQGHEAGAAFPASNAALALDAPIQFPVENVSRGLLAGIRATDAESTERGDN